MANDICHVEIATSNLAASRDFVQRFFGWAVTEMMPEYWLWAAPEGPGGGLAFSPEPPAEGAIAIYVGVEGLGAALGRATTLGAEVHRPAMVLPADHGHCAAIRIPGGAVLGLWSRTA
jgi:predicted enzyme related to lactoylglutathione lyase